MRMTTRMTASAAAGMRTDSTCLARWRHHGLGLWTALWLVLCLLLAQQAGLVHRVVHGGLLNLPISAPLTVSSIPDQTPDTHTHGFALKLGGHSCVLFDGATVADTHFGTVTLPTLRFGKPVKPAALAWRWPDLPARHPFHSRAPPAPLAFV
ncbi:hypothetical protein LMG32289_03444 [Cupriavidus pampae]|uniref:DUF2946 domain-containing protein n=2 Tax=Cupriavidus pampae TaxID=659251 RepID=A0ABM8X7F2_9BURK|nr:hypothetical protein LMG32289_03444 [Cupriavidus pampae]